MEECASRHFMYGIDPAPDIRVRDSDSVAGSNLRCTIFDFVSGDCQEDNTETLMRDGDWAINACYLL